MLEGRVKSSTQCNNALRQNIHYNLLFSLHLHCVQLDFNVTKKRANSKNKLLYFRAIFSRAARNFLNIQIIFQLHNNVPLLWSQC